MRKILSFTLAVAIFATQAMSVSAASTSASSANSAVSTDASKFLSDLAKTVKTNEFRLSAAKAIVALSDATKTGKYSDAYDLLPAYEKKVLSDRYGVDSAKSFTESVGPKGLAYKFAPADIVKRKATKFSLSSLVVSKAPISSDVVLDSSGSIIGAYVLVATPGAQYSDIKEGRWDAATSNTIANFKIFVTANGDVYPSYMLHPVRIISQGTGIDIIEIFAGNKNATAFSIGKTRGSSESDQSKLFGNGNLLQLLIKNSSGKAIIPTVFYAQNPKNRNNFRYITLNSSLTPGKEYKVEIWNSNSSASVKFRY